MSISSSDIQRHILQYALCKDILPDYFDKFVLPVLKPILTLNSTAIDNLRDMFMGMTGTIERNLTKQVKYTYDYNMDYFFEQKAEAIVKSFRKIGVPSSTIPPIEVQKIFYKHFVDFFNICNRIKGTRRDDPIQLADNLLQSYEDDKISYDDVVNKLNELIRMIPKNAVKNHIRKLIRDLGENKYINENINKELTEDQEKAVKDFMYYKNQYDEYAKNPDTSWIQYKSLNGEMYYLRQNVPVSYYKEVDRLLGLIKEQLDRLES